MQFNNSSVIRKSFICHSYVNRMYSYVTIMSFVCHSYLLVCHWYVTHMCSYVIYMYLYVIPMSFVCHSVCHWYNERILQVEHGSFTPLVMPATSGMSRESEKFYSRLAEIICKKKKNRLQGNYHMDPDKLHTR